MIMKLIINIEANNKFLLSDCIQAKLCTFVWLLIALRFQWYVSGNNINIGENMSFNIVRDNKKRVVIDGGGFGGLKLRIS